MEAEERKEVVTSSKVGNGVFGADRNQCGGVPEHERGVMIDEAREKLLLLLLVFLLVHSLFFFFLVFFT